MGQFQEVLVNFVLFAFLIMEASTSNKSTSEPMKPLGAHIAPKGVTLIGKFSSPGVFFQQFVKRSKPIHMKGVLQSAEYPLINKWNSKYLRKVVGEETVLVEPSKKEDRSKEKLKMTMNKFLNKFRVEDWYLVSPLPDKLKEDVYLPGSLTCGGLEKSLLEVVLWVSSGGTASVLHQDTLDNLLCVVSGTKEILLMDKAYKKLVESQGWVEQGSYSQVDVDAVDSKRFSRLTMVPWHSVHLEPGDCVYVPYKWYHQVRSKGGKSIAINFWFAHLWWLDQEACNKQAAPQLKLPLPPAANPNEALRSAFLEPFGDLQEIYEEDLNEIYPQQDSEVIEKFYEFVDKEVDDELTWPELYGFDIDEAIKKFPTLFTKLDHQNATKASRKPKPTPPPKQAETAPKGRDIVIKVPMEEGVVLDEELWAKMQQNAASKGEMVEEQDVEDEDQTEGKQRSTPHDEF